MGVSVKLPSPMTKKQSEKMLKKLENVESTLGIMEAIDAYERFMDEHPYFPRRGPTCHINSCKALEFFKKHKVKAELVYFNPKRLKEVKYAGLAPNHVWVSLPLVQLYYDAHARRIYSHFDHPYGDEELFSKPKYDKLSDIFPAHFMKAWERKRGEKICWTESTKSKKG